ncbi:MAG: isopentenyl transferase family protein, partial [Pseudomonadota bacterium]
MSPRRGPRTAVLIAGPTASGKSALAIDLARARPAVIVNADSMQVYDALPTLTAQPTRRERDEIPHRLYGHVSPETAYSVGAFVDDVARVLGMGGDGACGNDGDVARERLPIIVGGTGLYFKALTDGLAPVPAIREDVRA